METSNNTFGTAFTSKAVAFVAALLTTLFIVTSTAVIFTGGAIGA